MRINTSRGSRKRLPQVELCICRMPVESCSVNMKKLLDYHIAVGGIYKRESRRVPGCQIVIENGLRLILTIDTVYTEYIIFATVGIVTIHD